MNFQKIMKFSKSRNSQNNEILGFEKKFKKNYLFFSYKMEKKNKRYRRRKPNSEISEIFMRTREIQISMQRVRGVPNMPP